MADVSRMGSANAALFPVPVHPRMPMPSSAGGMQTACIGVGSELFRSSKTRSSGANSFKSLKLFKFLFRFVSWPIKTCFRITRWSMTAPSVGQNANLTRPKACCAAVFTPDGTLSAVHPIHRMSATLGCVRKLDGECITVDA